MGWRACPYTRNCRGTSHPTGNAMDSGRAKAGGDLVGCIWHAAAGRLPAASSDDILNHLLFLAWQQPVSIQDDTANSYNIGLVAMSAPDFLVGCVSVARQSR